MKLIKQKKKELIDLLNAYKGCEIANALGVSESYISRLKNGKYLSFEKAVEYIARINLYVKKDV